jgi:uridine kinase
MKTLKREEEPIQPAKIPMESAEDPAEILFRKKKIKVTRGTIVSDLMARYPHPDDAGVFAAVVNNRVVALSSKVQRSGTVEVVRYESRFGAQIYRRHITMMLYEVFYRLYPGCQISVGQAVSEGYYFEIKGRAVNASFVKTLTKGLSDLAVEKAPFVFHRVTVEEARRLFVNKGAPEKRDLLSTWPSGHVGIVQLKSFVDFAFGPVAPHTGFFADFSLFQVNGDLVLQFPDPHLKDMTRNTAPQPKLFNTLKDSRSFGNQLGVAHVGDLNRTCIDGGIREVIKVAEGRHEKRIGMIADEIAASKNRRLVLIAGPSSAGKTTFTKRLSIQLKVNHIEPVSISLDNYYIDRKKTPKDADGKYDFEALEAIDLSLFNHHLRDILDGKVVMTPRYDFNHGKRSDKDQIPIQLKDRAVLMIEGIHGLNDALTPLVPAKEKYRIYINALNPLAIDEHNRVHTSDARLIRRIVRDRHYRGYLASDTIHSWDSVRRGERKHIFPFQESADVIFDSSLIYEFSVLKVFAERYLLEVQRSDEAFAEAFRLRMFLAMFVPILPGDIPQTSLLREFIGGSSFHY